MYLSLRVLRSHLVVKLLSLHRILINTRLWFSLRSIIHIRIFSFIILLSEEAINSILINERIVRI
jgi:hypothetical protein